MLTSKYVMSFEIMKYTFCSRSIEAKMLQEMQSNCIPSIFNLNEWDHVSEYLLTYKLLQRERAVEISPLLSNT